MRRLTVTPLVFRRLAVAALAANVLIVVTGGLVRLTGSGLGCSSWPECEPGELVPGRSFHPWVEFGNRLVTDVVVLVTVATLVAALLRRPRRRDLTLLSLGLVAGVLAQVVLGGIVVLTDLTPPLVMAHFLVSMALVADATVLVERAGDETREPIPPVRPDVRLLSGVVSALGAVVLVLGTIVTGTGPHSGDRRSARLGWDLDKVVHLHSDVVLLMVGAVLALGVVLRFADVPARVRDRYRVLAMIVVVQTTVGFVQWFLRLPAGLVAVHVALATLFWMQALRLLLATLPHRAPAAPPVDTRAVELDRAAAR